VTVTAKGGKGTKAALTIWQPRLGHPSFKMVESAQSSMSETVTTDLPVKIPGLDACAAWVAKKSGTSHKEGRGRAGEYLKRVHINIDGPVPVALTGGREFEYVVVDDYTHAVYTRPPPLKSGRSKRSKRSGWRERASLARDHGGQRMGSIDARQSCIQRSCTTCV